jgi:hypothetical protein
VNRNDHAGFIGIISYAARGCPTGCGTLSEKAKSVELNELEYESVGSAFGSPTVNTLPMIVLLHN